MMPERTILNMEKPQTQTVAAVKSLLAWKGRASDPLPAYVEMGEGDNRLVLVLSNKRDAYYTTTARECSCPAHNWHPGQRCKHQRKYFAEQQTAHKPDAIISEHKPFRPFLEDEVRPAKVSSSSPVPLVDTLGYPTTRDIAYHSIQEDKALWPAEA